MVVVDILEDFIEAFSHEGPEVIDGTKVEYLVRHVYRPMMIWLSP